MSSEYPPDMQINHVQSSSQSISAESLSRPRMYHYQIRHDLETFCRIAFLGAFKVCHVIDLTHRTVFCIIQMEHTFV